MTEEDRIELGAMAIHFGVFDLKRLVGFRSGWDNVGDPDKAALREMAKERIATARSMKGNALSSWDWLLNA